MTVTAWTMFWLETTIFQTYSCRRKAASLDDGDGCTVNICKSIVLIGTMNCLGEKNDAYAQYFVGQSYLSMLTMERVGIANVTFEPGCRNNWHIHHKGGQILLCTAGRGYYQEWGKTAQEMKPGDIINIPPEVKHWHGAAPDSWFSHLAVEVPAEGSSNEWLEPVKEEEYSKLK